MPDFDTLQAAANTSRGLSIDAVAGCKSGHLGLPLGAAEIGAALFGDLLSYDPKKPQWLNRDRFILSAGHGSMFLYSWLHLAGYDVSLDDVKAFRKWGSKTPGHPEYHETPGVECTTGPLGQGIGNAVGYAVAGKMAAARYNTPNHTLFDSKVWCLAGDGCLQEGVAAEAAAFAGHQKLDNLILIFDSNDVTLDAMADKTQSEDIAARFEAYGFEIFTINDGNNLAEVHAVLKAAAMSSSNKPKFVEAKTLIGKGIPQVAGTQKAHGESGSNFADEARAALGISEPFGSLAGVSDFFDNHGKQLAKACEAWEAKFEAWKSANPEKSAELSAALEGEDCGDMLSSYPEFPADKALATRSAAGQILQEVAKRVPHLIGGSADLYGSTKNYLKEAGDFEPGSRDGRNFWFGIREHGMGAILNGIAYHGMFRASGATFMVFADYLRPSIRLAALCNLPVVYVFTHDSAGVGEDGPTHQPVETVAGLRVIPNLDVIRPADHEECVGAWDSAIARKNGPTVLSLTRQGVPVLAGNAQTKRQGVAKGGYVLLKETGPLERILMASGSEVQLAMAAAEKLGGGTRVVSMPCMERFERQSAEYQEEVLPRSCGARFAIEAGVSVSWYRWLGTDGKSIGINRFGASAPGAEVLRKLGITAEALVAAANGEA